MTDQARLTRRVILGTYLSSIGCILIYCIVLPISLLFDAEERLSFWIRMGTVGLVADFLATWAVYRIYRPVALFLKNGSGAEGRREAALLALDRVPNFLLWFGATAYVAAGAVNLGLDFLRNGHLDPYLAAARLFLALAWGFLNGITTARILEIILLEAKGRLGVQDLEEVARQRRRPPSRLRNRLMTPGMALFVFIVTYAGVILSVRIGAVGRDVAAEALRLVQGGADAAGLEAALGGFTSQAVLGTSAGAIAILVLLILIASLLYWIILSELQARFDALLRQTGRLATGDRDLGARVYVQSYDDVGKMTSSFNRILDGLAETFRGVRDRTGLVYARSAEIRQEAADAEGRARGLGQLAADNDAAERARVAELGRAVDAFRAAASAVGGSADESAAEAREIDRAAEAIKAMVASFAASGDEAREAEKAFRELSSVAREGSESVARALATAAEIGESGERVGRIASLIGEVADRSNLLAMNASIEAAHAGQAGKGFAVVAREIKKLAESTARSARDISAEVGAVADKNRRALEAIAALGSVFKGIETGVGRTGAALEAIAGSARRNAEEARGDLELIEGLRSFTEQIQAQSQDARRSVEAMEEAIARLSSSQERSGEVNAALGSGVRGLVDSFDHLESSLQDTLNGIQELERRVSAWKLE